MYSSRYARGAKRPGTRHFSAPKRGRNGPKKQYIDPRKFIKTAQPAATEDYQPDNNFSAFPLHPLLKNNIAVKGYKKPSEIQDKTIPLGLAGKDIVGIANTGTGKTAAFALPILNKLLHERSSQAIILAPTRELAIQIEEQCKVFAKNSGLTGVLLIGGMPMGRQTSGLRAGARVIIGTPGRTKDHARQGTLDLSKTSMVVLDEVDRMLDMGFITDIKFLLDQLPENRQSFFYSATMSTEVETLIKKFTNDAVTINVRASQTSDNVHQDIVEYGSSGERMNLLHDVLIEPKVAKTLIFAETKRGVEKLNKELVIRGFASAELHGGKTQGQRKRALDKFKNNQVSILVATDVAARGIDIVDISHVINYDTPQTYDDYIHRIGRAGRAGRPGFALTFTER